jgi:diguanylate cyclase (GGDEF)-like protein
VKRPLNIGASAVRGSGDTRPRIRVEWGIQVLRAGLVVLLLAVVFANADSASRPLFEVALAIGFGFQFFFAAVIFLRMRGISLRSLETAVPFGGILCIAFLWLALDQPESYLWAFFLYSIVVNSRRLEGRAFWSLAIFTIVLAAGCQVFLDARHGNGLLTLNGLVTFAVTLGMAVVASNMAARWREAEAAARLLAQIDPLTGLLNRRDFLAGFDTTDAGMTTYSVLMLDIDNFKRINDEQGHLEGDRVLVETAMALRELARPGDRMGRFGGEEFVVFLANAGTRTAMSLAEEARHRIRARTGATVTIGCATHQPGEESLAVLRRADDLLLKGKRSGKDQTLADAHQVITAAA